MFLCDSLLMKYGCCVHCMGWRCSLFPLAHYSVITAAGAHKADFSFHLFSLPFSVIKILVVWFEVNQELLEFRRGVSNLAKN